MKSLAVSFTVAMVVLVTGGAVWSAPADEYEDYYAARQAGARGDCKALVEHLDAFLKKHPYVPEEYPDFYSELRYVKAQCTGTVIVRGVEGESAGLDPLPEDPPMVEPKVADQ